MFILHSVLKRRLSAGSPDVTADNFMSRLQKVPPYSTTLRETDILYLHYVLYMEKVCQQSAPYYTWANTDDNRSNKQACSPTAFRLTYGPNTVGPYDRT